MEVEELRTEACKRNSDMDEMRRELEEQRERESEMDDIRRQMLQMSTFMTQFQTSQRFATSALALSMDQIWIQIGYGFVTLNPLSSPSMVSPSSQHQQQCIEREKRKLKRERERNNSGLADCGGGRERERERERERRGAGVNGGQELRVNVSSFFRCPISLDVMRSPVSLCGVTYNCSSIQAWLDTGHNTCPQLINAEALLCGLPSLADPLPSLRKLTKVAGDAARVHELAENAVTLPALWGILLKKVRELEAMEAAVRVLSAVLHHWKEDIAKADAFTVDFRVLHPLVGILKLGSLESRIAVAWVVEPWLRLALRPSLIWMEAVWHNRRKRGSSPIPPATPPMPQWHSPSNTKIRRSSSVIHLCRATRSSWPHMKTTLWRRLCEVGHRRCARDPGIVRRASASSSIGGTPPPAAAAALMEEKKPQVKRD
ncbi:hypothetical protein Taro_029551 [Colocasia esculenta]|uniref:U-box domain-containing protein n=1 Tax=Colocasia esculenta TaxID=4460 RepID=A0A843VJ84_COLES|nr:hypothetical protein [Colocasia esculenta]